MKTVFLIGIGLLSLLLLSFKYSKVDLKKDTPTGIQFHKGSWDEALLKAQKEKKLIFLDVYATWCGPCKRLKTNTFTDKEVSEYYNANFINVSADGESGEGILLSTRYNVQQYPTLLFIDSSGEVKSMAVGYHSSMDFISLGKTVLAK